MQQFSLVYNNIFVFLEPVDEPRPTYTCGQLMQGSSIFWMIENVNTSKTRTSTRAYWEFLVHGAIPSTKEVQRVTQATSHVIKDAQSN